MAKKQVKAYMYTRVSTSMQVDGYSLDAQKEKIKKYADAFEYEIAEEYEEAIITMNLWEAAQEKRKAQAKKYEHVNKGKDEKIHLLSGLLRCPVCSSGMYGNKSIKNKNGKHYKDYFYYGCKHRGML